MTLPPSSLHDSLVIFQPAVHQLLLGEAREGLCHSAEERHVNFAMARLDMVKNLTGLAGRCRGVVNSVADAAPSQQDVHANIFTRRSRIT